MRITLPVSNRSIELAIFDHKTGKGLKARSTAVSKAEDYLSAYNAFMEERDVLLRELYTSRGVDVDELPHRDVVILYNVTYAYNMGETVAAIKNSLAGGDGALITTEPDTAPTAAEALPSEE